MPVLPRQRIRPVGGYSPRPVDPSECRAIVNLQMTRDGVFVPRPGLRSRLSLASAITHLSNWPSPGYMTAGTWLILIEGGNLRRVSSTTYAQTLLDTGWPTGIVKPTIGASATSFYWLAHKAAIFNQNAAALYKINAAGTFAAVGGGAPSGTWVENFGRFSFVCNHTNRITFSNLEDSDTWTAADYITTPWEIGDAHGCIALSDSQLIVLGTNGTALVTGNIKDNFSQYEQYHLRLIPQGQCTVKAGDTVITMGAGSRLYLYNAGLKRFDQPVEDDLDDLGDVNSIYAWYDQVIDTYFIGDSASNKTYAFDMSRGRWMGWWDKFLVGYAVNNNDTHPRQQRYLGYGTALVELDSTYYQDAGVNFTCQLDIANTAQANANAHFDCGGVYVDGSGTWTVTLLTRNAPEASFAAYAGASGNVSAPGYIRFPTNQYNERVIRLTATAASGLSLRGIEVDERLARSIA